MVLTAKEGTSEHDALYQQCYGLLRMAKQHNVERERARLCDQDKERAVELTVSRLMEIKWPWGSVHKKVKALIDGINNARSSLRTEGAEKELFSKRFAI